MADGGSEGKRDIESLTLKDLLSLSPGDIPEPSVLGGVDSEALRNLQKQLSAQSLPIAWSRIQSEIAGVLGATLNTNVVTLWARGWTKYQGLMEDVKRSRQSPESVVLSPLAEHSIDSTVHPFVEITLGPKTIQKIYFDVTLNTHIEGLVLGLKNAHIVSLQMTKCEWSGTIQLETATLVRRPLAALSLPGCIELKHGIPLGDSK